MEDNKYYTPKLEEIHVGYEMEWLQRANENAFVLDGVTEDTWQKWDYNFQGFSIKGLRHMIENGTIRTKCLTQEQIEEEGWKRTRDETSSYEGIWEIVQPSTIEGQSDNVWELSHYGKIISISQDLSNRCYDGECKSINELRKIMQWLHITK